MSVEALALVLHHSRSSGTDKVVLLGIANHEGDGGAFPSIATLAKYANVDARTVQRSLRRLEEAGEVVVHLGAGGRATTPHGQRTNRYEVRVTCPSSCDRSTNHRVTPDVDVTPDADVTCTPDVGVTPTPDASVTPPLTWASPEPSSNRPENHPSEPSHGDDFDSMKNSSSDDDSDASDRQTAAAKMTEQESAFVRQLLERIDVSDFDGADTDTAIALVRSFWAAKVSRPFPDYVATAVTRRIRTRDYLARTALSEQVTA